MKTPVSIFAQWKQIAHFSMHEFSMYYSVVTWMWYGVSYHRPSNVCSIAWSSQYQRTYQSSTLVALCKGNPPMHSQSASQGESVPTSWFRHVLSLLFHTWNMIATSENLPRRTQPMVMDAAAFGNRGKVRYQSMLLPATNSRLIKGTWLVLGLRPANERRRYKVTSSLIGWAQT